MIHSLACPIINTKVRKNVKKCLDDGMIGGGEFVGEFERKVAEFVGAKHGVSVCNGTIADIVALAVLKQKRPEKTEVVVTSLTFIAQTNAILWNGLTPVFVDVDEFYQARLDQIKEKITENTLAVFAVHLLGRDCGIEELKKICDEKGVYLIEDCCEAFGGEVNGKKFGTFGNFGTFSFFPSHTIVTGEGGMIVTNDDELADLARKVNNHSRRGNNVLDKFHFDSLGINGKMSNVLCAIGCGVIGEAQKVIEKRRKNVEIFNHLRATNWFASSPHCMPVIYMSEEKRDEALKRLDSAGVECRKLFSCIPHKEPHFFKYKGSYPVADDISQRSLFVPVHQNLTEEDIQFICTLL